MIYSEARQLILSSSTARDLERRLTPKVLEGLTRDIEVLANAEVRTHVMMRRSRNSNRQPYNNTISISRQGEGYWVSARGPDVSDYEKGNEFNNPVSNMQYLALAAKAFFGVDLKPATSGALQSIRADYDALIGQYLHDSIFSADFIKQIPEKMVAGLAEQGYTENPELLLEHLQKYASAAMGKKFGGLWWDTYDRTTQLHNGIELPTPSGVTLLRGQYSEPVKNDPNKMQVDSLSMEGSRKGLKQEMGVDSLINIGFRMLVDVDWDVPNPQKGPTFPEQCDYYQSDMSVSFANFNEGGNHGNSDHVIINVYALNGYNSRLDELAKIIERDLQVKFLVPQPPSGIVGIPTCV